MFDYNKMYTDWDKMNADQKADQLKSNLKDLDREVGDYITDRNASFSRIMDKIKKIEDRLDSLEVVRKKDTAKA